MLESTAVLNCDQNGAQSMRSPLNVGRWSLGSWMDLDLERVVVEVEDEGVDSLSLELSDSILPCSWMSSW